MRTALVAALRRTASGALRAELPLAGRSVLARQVEVLRAQGCERILCLCERVDGEVLRVQQAVEASGGTFQALRGFLHLPALVRAEDDLVILADGLLPDPGLVRALFADGAQPPRFVASLPADSPLVALHPDDFERIDAGHHWAGLLAMRGAPVQQLADFPSDADAVSLLLRLALQAGTPCRALPDEEPSSKVWLLADDPAALAVKEQALIARAAGPVDWRAPMIALANRLVESLMPRALPQGAQAGAAASILFLALGVLTAASGAAAAGLGLAACGAFALNIAGAFARLRLLLLGEGPSPVVLARLGWVADGLAAIVLLFALAPWPVVLPLAVLGPLAIGLARLAAQGRRGAVAIILSDRIALLAGFAIAHLAALLPEALALFCLVVLAALLLRSAPD
ncbi:hypothetical protein [Erythrobacter sanguineus]|uniref:MobA-like NTP transferase domain-containing protein n=1 Tax=Erythrobacter sanguineus TaxID=198312 RepID=A0A1M7S5S4_9SPHN|nr:hypothetical protein [Erythrobacter sanguineus]SHN53780.1 hypothetical protein SAMN02745193_01026 [Erythrobacter sanguineus]